MDGPRNVEGLVACIFKQAKGEEDAKMEYMEFLSKWSSFEKFQAADIAAIKEILRDESVHTLTLLAMAKKYSKIKPADDGLAEALEALSK